jgi:hypothetical protein
MARVNAAPPIALQVVHLWGTSPGEREGREGSLKGATVAGRSTVWHCRARGPSRGLRDPAGARNNKAGAGGVPSGPPYTRLNVVTARWGRFSWSLSGTTGTQQLPRRGSAKHCRARGPSQEAARPERRYNKADAGGVQRLAFPLRSPILCPPSCPAMARKSCPTSLCRSCPLSANRAGDASVTTWRD